MSNIEQVVGEFSFGTGKISADRTGILTLYLYGGARWSFDVGEISSLDRILLKIEGKKAEPTEDKPEIFWRTNGSKIIEVFLGKALFRELDIFESLGLSTPTSIESVVIREGGSVIGRLPISEISTLRRHIRILTDGAPYPKAVTLIDVVEEKRKESLIRVERYPLNNRNSGTPLRVEREFSQEIIKAISIDASFGAGLDYYVKLNLETKFGLTREQKASESVKVSMEAEPGVHKEYLVNWKETTITGYAVFDVNGIREKVPFNLKSGLIPEVRQEIIARD